MILLATSDIHQHSDKWKKLVQACRREKPDLVVLAGDLFPKENGILVQMSWVAAVKTHVRAIRDSGSEIVLILGNDDNQLLIPEMEAGEHEGLWHYIGEKTVPLGHYTFTGVSSCPDYPFGYKFWVAGEYRDRLRISPAQFHKPMLVNEKNEFEAIPDFEQYLLGKETMWERLLRCRAGVPDMSRSIWLIHSPPMGHGLDACYNGENVGSAAVLQFVKEHKPFMVISGHIHESPSLTGKWMINIGGTLCIQGGQMGRTLHYVMAELEGTEVRGIRHSIYRE